MMASFRKSGFWIDLDLEMAGAFYPQVRRHPRDALAFTREVLASSASLEG
jgi:hypothetical protein